MTKKCVKCGYVRSSLDTAAEHECPKCGVIYAKAEAVFAAGQLPILGSSGKKPAAQSISSARKSSRPKVFAGIAVFGLLALLVFGGLQFKKKLLADQEFKVRKQGRAELEKVEAAWRDANRLASVTGRIALSGPVQSLQTVKRNFTAVKVGKCLEPAKALFDSHMDLVVKGYIAFMGKEELTSNLLMIEAREKIDAYRVARDGCENTIKANSD